MSYVNCDSSKRCFGCPIDKLADAGDRLQGGNAVRSVVRTLEHLGSEDDLASIRAISDDVATEQQITHLTGPIIGATAINLTGYCKPESEGI